MRALTFLESELESALARSVTQCVMIGSPPALNGALQHFETFHVSASPSEELSAALARSQFDRLKGTLFVWLGGFGYRTMDTVLATLSYIASLPAGSGVLLDYAPERSAVRVLADTALDALASQISFATGDSKQLLEPPALSAMLKGFGFQHINDLAGDDGLHLISAVL